MTLPPGLDVQVLPGPSQSHWEQKGFRREPTSKGGSCQQGGQAKPAGCQTGPGHQDSWTWRSQGSCALHSLPASGSRRKSGVHIHQETKRPRDSTAGLGKCEQRSEVDDEQTEFPQETEVDARGQVLEDPKHWRGRS